MSLDFKIAIEAIEGIDIGLDIRCVTSGGDRVEADESDSMLQNRVLTKQVVDIGGLHFGIGLGSIANGLSLTLLRSLPP
ncbi:hypothetical protein Tco_0947627, partial [Tanacetum coccineum]